MLPRKFRRTEAGHDLTDYGYEEAESSGQMDEGSGKQQVATESKTNVICNCNISKSKF